ncbi:hypothetical protein ABPG75_009996 [Micractinium tetrahymenae]
MPSSRFTSFGRLPLHLQDTAVQPASPPPPPDGAPSPGAAAAGGTSGIAVDCSSQSDAPTHGSALLALGIVAIFLAVTIVVFKLYYRSSCCALLAPLRSDGHRAGPPCPSKAAAVQAHPPPVVVVMPDRQLQCAVPDGRPAAQNEHEHCRERPAELPSPEPRLRPWGHGEFLCTPKVAPPPAVPLWTMQHCCGADAESHSCNCSTRAGAAFVHAAETSSSLAETAAGAAEPELTPAPVMERRGSRAGQTERAAASHRAKCSCSCAEEE